MPNNSSLPAILSLIDLTSQRVTQVLFFEENITIVHLSLTERLCMNSCFATQIICAYPSELRFSEISGFLFPPRGHPQVKLALFPPPTAWQ